MSRTDALRDRINQKSVSVSKNEIVSVFKPEQVFSIICRLGLSAQLRVPIHKKTRAPNPPDVRWGMLPDVRWGMVPDVMEGSG